MSAPLVLLEPERFASGNVGLPLAAAPPPPPPPQPLKPTTSPSRAIILNRITLLLLNIGRGATPTRPSEAPSRHPEFIRSRSGTMVSSTDPIALEPGAMQLIESLPRHPA